jgi:hypothetical protein
MARTKSYFSEGSDFLGAMFPRLQQSEVKMCLGAKGNFLPNCVTSLTRCIKLPASKLTNESQPRHKRLAGVTTFLL